MQTTANTDYCPSATWHQFLRNLLWQQDTYADSAYEAFTEAIRRGISRAEAFFDVAEATHRSYCSVNWGVLNWRWKQAFQDANHDSRNTNPAPKLKAAPPPPSFQPSLSPANGNGAPYLRGHYNGAKHHQRRPASLVSYYE
jgi:hypothetical protein